MPFSTISADPQQSIIFHSRELRLKRHNERLAVLAAKRSKLANPSFRGQKMFDLEQPE
jgi:hypothetical protein